MKQNLSRPIIFKKRTDTASERVRPEAGPMTRSAKQSSGKGRVLALDCFGAKLIAMTARGMLGTGTSLFAILAGNQVVFAQSTTPVPDISVNAAATEPAEGSEAAGYKPDTVSNLGPLGKTPILDVPYSVNVISAPLIENLQAYLPDQVFKVSPVIQPSAVSQRTFSPGFTLRGFTPTNGVGLAEDGMILQNLFAEPLEDKERVEIYTGLTSFLYGPTNVGGLINYAYKRPTETPLANVTVGDYGGLSAYTHVDFGGPIDKEGRFSYRLNIVGQDGDTAVNTERVKRDLITAALTWHVTSGADVTWIGSHDDQNFRGVPALWNFATNANGSAKVFNPAAPDPTQNWTQPWTGYSAQRDRVGVESTWKLNDIFTLRTSYAYSLVTIRDPKFVNDVVSGNTGTYTQLLTISPNSHYFANTGYSFIDASFDIGFVHNKLTTGFYGNDFRTAQSPTTYTPTNYGGSGYAAFNFVSPTYFSEPAFAPSGVGPARTLNYNYQKNFILGDEIKFSEQWSALLGGNYATLAGSNFNTTTGALTSAYDQGRLSPSASLIFKPVPWISTYATYSESLQPGQVVPSTGGTVYTNGGQVLSPYVGREYEVGAKADIHGILLTGSLFQIDQALQYAQYNNDGTFTYVQNGRQRDRGIELTATGTVFEGLRILGGLTVIDPRVTQSATSATVGSLNGKQPVNVANQLEKLTAEYDLPFLKGFTLTGGFYFTGQQAVDTLNTEFLPGFTTQDLGFRYRMSEMLGQKLPLGQELVLRFDVTNITNKNYWLNSRFVGEPRNFMASAQMKF